MSSIEEIWAETEVGEPGGAIRISAEHPCDLFGATDQQGRRGLVLVTATEPPLRPSLDSVEITCGKRGDGRWALGIWLRDPSLLPVFAHLCTDLIESSRSSPAESAATFLIARLTRWRELLESGTGPMSVSALRGLVGELIVFEKCLDFWPAADVVAGWAGPLGGPQDFVLPRTRVEVKTTFASARSVHISSADQLDTDEPLTLAVVTLTTLVQGEGVAPAELVARIEQRLSREAADLAAIFRKRLDAAGYLPDPLYSKPMFRLDGIDYFDVSGNFPRIRRDVVPAGVEKLVYDVLIGSCAPHRSHLQG
jgi:hypothetical protein